MLQCHVDGSPPPSVSWSKDGQPLAESVRRRVLSSGSLQLAFVQSDDAGRYACAAANPAGAASLEMSLTVQGRLQQSSVAATSHPSFPI